MARFARRATVRTLAISLALALVVGSALAFHGRTAPARAQQPPSPLEVRASAVSGFYAAEGRGDVDGAAAVFTDNGVWSVADATSPCFRTHPCSDGAGIRAELQSHVDDHRCRTIVELDVAGAVVTGRLEIRDDTLRARGIERGIQSFLAVVPQDKMAYLTIVGDPADPATALNQAITAGTAQPVNPPIPAPTAPCGGV